MKFLIIINLLIAAAFATAQDKTWDAYGQILSKGIVELKYSGEYGTFNQNAFDYKKAKSDSKTVSLLKEQKNVLSTFQAPENRFEKLAFWINAYNFFTLVDVIANLPIKSMKDIGWKNKHHIVGGQKYSLDEIEHKIIRPMGDARIHFAVNCASVSCPSLKSTPFTNDGIRVELTEQTKEALRNPLHIQPDWGDVEVTKLFSWFSDDFETKLYKDAEGFLKKYAPEKLQKEIDGWLDYDWNVNTPENIKQSMSKLKVKQIN